MKLRTIFQAGAQAVLNQVRLFAKKEGQPFTALKNGLAKIMSGRKFWGMWADPSSPTPVSLLSFSSTPMNFFDANLHNHVRYLNKIGHQQDVCTR
jgi:hypothetical protein